MKVEQKSKQNAFVYAKRLSRITSKLIFNHVKKHHLGFTAIGMLDKPITLLGSGNWEDVAPQNMARSQPKQASPIATIQHNWQSGEVLPHH